MALCCEVIDLVGLGLLDDADERTGVGHIAIVQVECPTTLHVAHPLLEVKVLDTLRVEGRGASDDTMDFVALLDEELCEEGAVLARYPGDECDLIHVSIIGLIYSVCSRGSYPSLEWGVGSRGVGVDTLVDLDGLVAIACVVAG